MIKGWIYKMPASPSGRSPAPRRVHQKIQLIISNGFYNYFKENKCEVYTAPFDVRLIKNKGKKDQQPNTVVQPDICIICDLEKLDDAGCLGAPDLIVEILSDSTAKKDYNEKFNLYEENKVKEYWIVNPATKNIEIFSLIDEKYESLGLFNETEGLKEVVGTLFPEMKISLKTIFAD